jgi:hypothetical protein
MHAVQPLAYVVQDLYVIQDLMSSRYQAITGAWIEFRCRR